MVAKGKWVKEKLQDVIKAFSNTQKHNTVTIIMQDKVLVISAEWLSMRKSTEKASLKKIIQRALPVVRRSEVPEGW